MSYKPDTYTSVAPYLVVNGAGATIDFLIAVFDAERLRIYPDAAGKVMHGEVRIDDTVVMLGDASPEWPASNSHVHIYVADADAVYRRALAAGATAVREPVQGQDGDKRGGFRDAGGTTWWVATQVG